MSYRYDILGTTRARGPDGVEVPVSGARMRALLTALAAAGGRTVTAGRLAARIRDDGREPPADEPAALQALVGRLRRALGADAVESVPGGYRLAADPDAIDLFRFERLAADGVSALDSGDPARAATLLDRALALWRGPALADLPDGDTDPSAVRARRRHTEARRARLTADVRLGRPERALPGLAALAAEAPLDEPLQAARIGALRAAGRRAEALEAYDGVRALLADRLGTGPGRELRALHADLLADDAHDARDASDAREPARPPARVGGSDRPPSALPGGLPARLTSFVGRETELDTLDVELRAHRLTTLTGPGGAGKTRLAFEAAERAANTGGDWPDGVRVAELASVRDPGAVAEAVLTALGARETAVHGPGGSHGGPDGTAPGPLARLVEHCGTRRLLLVLDNCEQVIGAAAELAETVLTRCPYVTVLATSREPLGVRGEFLYGVGPLARSEALRLLGERGAAARPGFRTDDDAPACDEICRRLDGLPLALELAAARLRLLTPRQLADRLDDRFRLLGAGSGSRTVLPRQQTLRAVVDWSWDLLTEPERAVLRRLSVFVGGCAPDEAEEVCADENGEVRAGGTGESGAGEGVPVFDVLASLVDKSLLVAVPGGPEGMRYRLLETVAEYAAGRLDASGERPGVELRHLRVYRELVRVGEPGLRGPRQAYLLAQFEREHDNVRAALRTALGRAAPHRDDAPSREQDALCLTLSLSWFWQVRGHQRDAHDWSTAVAALGPDPFAAPVRPAVPLTDPCIALPPPWSEEQVWEARRGVRLLTFASGGGGERAGERPGTRPGEWTEGGAENGDTRRDVDRGKDEGKDWDEDDARAWGGAGTRDLLTRIVAAYRPGLPQVSRQPAVLWFFAGLLVGRWRGMGETLDVLVDACRARPDRGWDLGLALTLRAKLLDTGPDTEDRAARDADEAVALFEQAGDSVILAESLSARGESYERRGRFEEAAADFERAMENCARIGMPTQVSLFKARLASVRLEAATGEAAEADAERLLREAVEESRGHAGRTGGTARLLLAGRYGRTGRTALARDQLITLQEEPGFREHGLQVGLTEGLHGWLDCLDGAYERALAHLRESVRLLDSLAHLVAPQLIVSQFLCAAWAKTGTGRAADGARLLGAYARHAGLAEKFLFHPYPAAYEREIRRRAEAEVRAALDPDTWTRAYADGGGLSVKEAAAVV